MVEIGKNQFFFSGVKWEEKEISFIAFGYAK